MSDMKAGAVVTLVGNDQLAGVFAVPLRHLLGDRHAGVSSLPMTASDSRIFPFADDRHCVPPVQRAVSLHPRLIRLEDLEPLTYERVIAKAPGIKVWYVHAQRPLQRVAQVRNGKSTAAHWSAAGLEEGICSNRVGAGEKSPPAPLRPATRSPCDGSLYWPITGR